MHQNAANGMLANTPLFVPAAVDTIGDASPVRAFSLKRELRRVVKDQHCVLVRRKAIKRRLKVPLQDVSFIDPLIGEKAICSFGVRPVLASHRYAFTYRIPDLRQQFPESPIKANIRKLAPSSV